MPWWREQVVLKTGTEAPLKTRSCILDKMKFQKEFLITEEDPLLGQYLGACVHLLINSSVHSHTLSTFCASCPYIPLRHKQGADKNTKA
ncbi:hypothetical protein MATL_G00193690 [Megalops atlanticus]|uniref:Uncharacterized protein n=1 Tax=Megalops atlanticus TaxID=7932 RepID=A0A9D3PLN7_MEGAT|nr:hypothetical protein MATL_G00193690 [Megalops atlanticus]